MANNSFSKIGHILLYSIPLLLAIGIATLPYSYYANIPLLGLLSKMIQFFNPETKYTADYLYANIGNILGYTFYVALFLLFVVMILVIWDFFRKKKRVSVTKEIDDMPLIKRDIEKIRADMERFTIIAIGICPNCKSKINDSQNFCIVCGKYLR